MPTYDYVCEACGHQEEIFQSMSEKPKRTCTQCKARKFKRLIGTGAGVIFKGSGFYETDYKKKSKPSAKKDSSSESKSESKSETKSESNSDTKSDSSSASSSSDD